MTQLSAKEHNSLPCLRETRPLLDLAAWLRSLDGTPLERADAEDNARYLEELHWSLHNDTKKHSIAD